MDKYGTKHNRVQVKDSHRYFVPVLLLEKRSTVCTTYVVHNGADVANEEEEKEEEE